MNVWTSLCLFDEYSVINKDDKLHHCQSKTVIIGQTIIFVTFINRMQRSVYNAYVCYF